MCGIAGIVVRSDRRADRATLDRLTQAIAHRGPDGAGRYVNGSAALINTRLAIIDLKTGDQPFNGPAGIELVANGEIYNDLELRARLKSAPFSTGSDCESPLHLYRETGLDFVEGLRGMYAIAIHDPANAKLVLARDPFGIKPLYFVSKPGYFAFASEPQALLNAGLADRRIDAQKRSELLQLKFTTGGQTIFSDIKRVLPGETIVVSAGQIVDRRKQRVLSRQTAAIDADPLQSLDRILEDSVRAHIRSDVPYGLFLSGGIDSAALLALMARISPEPVVAFTAVFPESNAADEREAASRVARAAGAQHHVVELTQDDFWMSAPRLAAALDDPTTDAAALPTFKLAARAREAGVKVVLSGEGGDEIFAGYSRYRRAAWLWGLFGRRSRTRGVFDRLAKGGAGGPFPAWRTGLEKSERQEIASSRTPIQQLQAIDCAEWLPNDLLVKLDRCLMAHGVEGRTPFLDPVVGPFAFDLPDRLKISGGFGKWLLRKWLSENLPSADAFAKKTGFNPPIGEWIEFRKSDLEKLVLGQPGIAEMGIDDLVRKTMVRPSANSQAAWSLVFYALWHSHHVLGVGPDGSVADVLHEASKRG